MNKIQFKMFNAYFPHKRRVRPYKHMPYLAESYEHYDRHYGDLEDQPINRKTHYYSLTDHDVLLHLWSKMSNTDQWDNHYFSFRRAEQLGIISRQDIQDRFDPNKPLRPFNFEMLDKEVNKRTSLFRPKTEE